MKLRKIEYHLQRAAIARADHTAGRPVSQGGKRYGSHLDRAQYHDDKAAEYLAEGIQARANLAQTKGARDQRRLRRRRGGIDARRVLQGQGRGAHNRGKLFGRHLQDPKPSP